MAEKKNNGIKEWIPKDPDHLPQQILSNYRFAVYIMGMKMRFSRITNLETFVETEAFAEGGVNDYAYSLRKPVTREKVMTLERGVIGVSSFDMMETMLLSRFHIGHRIPVDVAIAVAGTGGKIEKMYFVHGATVKSWKCSDLDAMNGRALIETFSITYETLEEADEIAGIVTALGGDIL